MKFPRFFSPTVTTRLFDPMPLPRKDGSVRRMRIAVKAMNSKSQLNRTGKFTFKVQKIPLNA
jgi:hypothetical protein